ncbi:MAG: 8-oxo-dGTP diphosphatase MutT [Gammaproteobacteria bacterium]|nr:8-oxo-dGTP diphosphatase MutT [Gammaproteobacteria bacterium]
MSTVHVAVGVVLNDKVQVLLARRAQHLHQGGLWEFPGGKLEPGESVEQALVRELREELAINAEAFAPFLKIAHDYGDKQVLLDVWLVDRFTGSPAGVEGQQVRWSNIADLDKFDFPAANAEIIKKLFTDYGEQVV